MKRVCMILLACLMAVSLLACSAPAENTQASPAAQAEQPKTETQQAPETEKPQTEAEQPVQDEPAEPEQPAYEIDQIRIGTTAQIEQAVIGEYAYEMLASGTTHIPLVWQDTEGAFHPLLASWSTEDSVTWTYTIEENMRWQDGEPVTAEDILFTLQYEDANGSANLTDQTDSEGKVTKAKYTAYEISDDGRSISLTLSAPNVRELGNMTSFRTLPKHVYEGKETLSEEDLRFGCGPYVFTSFNKDAGTITFTASETYPVRPHVRELVYYIIPEMATEVMALINGEIDMQWTYSTGISAEYLDILTGADNVELIPVTAQNEPAVLAFNNAKGPFANEDLRLAVGSMLDYALILEKLGSGQAETANRGFVPVSTVGYVETEKLKTDLAKAEEYMKAAGFSKNQDGKYANADGNVFAFTLTYRSDRNVQVSAAELIKRSVDAFGGEVTLEGLDSDSYNAKTSNRFSENNITMEAALYGYTSAGMGMGNGLGTIYVDGNHAVQGGAQVYAEEFQSALKRLSEAKTPDEYLAGAKAVQMYYAEHLPVIALYWDALTYAASANYINLVVDNVFGLNNVNNWLSVTGK